MIVSSPIPTSPEAHILVLLQRMERCSADAVIQCDDLLMEILIRLPLKEVLKSKCVSKAWNNMISDSRFRRRYISERKNSSLPLVGFFQASFMYKINIPVEYRGPGISFLSTSKEGRSMMQTSLQSRLVKKLGFFMRGSPQGLILCGWRPRIFYVCNPLQNHWLSLPKPRIQGDAISIGFSSDECDDNGITNFTVVRSVVNLSRLKDNKMVVESFSSRTGEWCVSHLSSPIDFELVLCSMCEVVGGVFYWEAKEDYVAAHDPRISNNHVWLMRLPINEFNIMVRDSSLPEKMMRVLGQSSSNGLLKCALGSESGLQIWILKKKLSEYSFSHIIQISEWVLTDTVTYSSLPISYPQTMKHVRRSFETFYFTSAFHPQDSTLLYLQRNTEIYCCNLETRTVEFVEYEGFALRPCYYDIVPFIQPVWPPTLPYVFIY